jgi:hypothetical protein
MTQNIINVKTSQLSPIFKWETVQETKQKQFYGKVHKYHIQYSRCRQSKIKYLDMFRLAETYVIKKGGDILQENISEENTNNK